MTFSVWYFFDWKCYWIVDWRFKFQNW